MRELIAHRSRFQHMLAWLKGRSAPLTVIAHPSAVAVLVEQAASTKRATMAEVR